VSKQPTISTIASGFYSTSALNVNFENLRDQFDNTLSLDGSTPNAMLADLDLNSNDLMNAGAIYSDRLFLNGLRVTSVESNITWAGEWATATDYVVDQLVRDDGTVYICLVDHTSGTFATDLSNSYWEVFAQKGSAGAGTGDLLSANNLSDLSDSDAALSNLGGGSVGISIFKDTTAADVRTEISAQQSNGLLDDISGLSLSQGDILYYDGSDITNLGKGTANQVLAMNSGAVAPEWQSQAIGIGQTWQNTGKVKDTTYQNTTGRPIMVFIDDDGGTAYFQISTNGTSWDTLYTWAGGTGSYERNSLSIVIPDQLYYRVSGGNGVGRWWELR